MGANREPNQPLFAIISPQNPKTLACGVTHAAEAKGTMSRRVGQRMRLAGNREKPKDGKMTPTSLRDQYGCKPQAKFRHFGQKTADDAFGTGITDRVAAQCAHVSGMNQHSLGRLPSM
jgi:hypothetical protein